MSLKVSARVKGVYNKDRIITPITITENGVYNAGKGGFNPVEVRVEGNKDLIDCESLPTEGVQEGKIYRARWSETVEVPPSVKICVTDGVGTAPYEISLEDIFGFSGGGLIEVNTVDEIPSEFDGENFDTLYLCNADGILYVSQTVLFSDLNEFPRDVNVGFISSKDNLDVNKLQLGVIKVGSEIVTTNYEQIGLPEVENLDRSVMTYEDGVWFKVSPLRDVITALRGARNLFNGYGGKTVDHLICYRDTFGATSMYCMFAYCHYLKEVPLLDTHQVDNMSNMFLDCNSLTEVPLFDTRNVTDMTSMFRNCTALTEVPLFDTRKVRNMSYMFYVDNYADRESSLTTVPALDVRNVTSISVMLYGCKALTECWIKNIRTSLQVGSGTTYGHLLTVDSLVHLIYELSDMASSKTLTVGSANLKKLANVYVRLIDITDEMRAEDDLIDEKLPFEVCESTDEGAMLITDYAYMKKWNIK